MSPPTFLSLPAVKLRSPIILVKNLSFFLICVSFVSIFFLICVSFLSLFCQSLCILFSLCLFVSLYLILSLFCQSLCILFYLFSVCLFVSHFTLFCQSLYIYSLSDHPIINFERGRAESQIFINSSKNMRFEISNCIHNYIIRPQPNKRPLGQKWLWWIVLQKLFKWNLLQQVTKIKIMIKL